MRRFTEFPALTANLLALLVFLAACGHQGSAGNASTIDDDSSPADDDDASPDDDDNDATSDWTAMSSGTTETLWGIWGFSGSDVFVVGEGGTILHYNGAAWAPMPSGTTAYLSGVWGSSPSDMFATGSTLGSVEADWRGTILRYDGSSWSETLGVTGWEFNGVWGFSPSDVFVTGGNNTETQSTILHFDGWAWAPMKAGQHDASLSGIWGSSHSDVFVVGTDVGLNGAILHYDGSAWTQMAPYIAPSSDLDFVWGASASCVYANGGTNEYPWVGFVLFYDGESWTKPFIGEAALNGIGVFWGESANDVYGVGGYLSFSQPSTPVQMSAIAHFDGSSWSTMPTAAAANLTGVWGSSTSDVFAVGYSGTILHYAGPSVDSK
jgi:hypothetical protein